MTPSDRPAETDVIVAGGGAAGLTAALAAAAGGARVLLAERAADLGGTTAFGGGRTWVPGNHFPENSGDTRAAARGYLLGIFGDGHPHMIDAFLDGAPEMARFVERHSPHRWQMCPNYPDYHPSRPGGTLGGRCLDVAPIDTTRLSPLARRVRVPHGYVPMTHNEWERWRYPDRFDWDLIDERLGNGIRTGGVGMVAGLVEGLVRMGVQITTGTRITGVDRAADGSVTAAHLQDAAGETLIRAHAVILATGDFAWDPALREALPSSLHGLGAPPTNTGDALRIAERAGAAAENMGEGWWMPMLAIPGETMDGEQFYRSLVRERGAPRQIIVNARGERFANEAMPYNEIGKALHRQDAGGDRVNDPAYMVFDAGFRRKYALPGMPPGRPVPGWVASSGTLAGLAAATGVDAAGLDRTVTRWNHLCEKGRDRDFGRGDSAYDRYCGDPEMPLNPNMAPLDEPPYFAVRVLAGTIGTKGGPVTDADGVVLTRGGDRVRGLYAAGNAAAFWTSDGYPAPGATLGVGMTMGYRAGRHAASRT